MGVSSFFQFYWFNDIRAQNFEWNQKMLSNCIYKHKFSQATAFKLALNFFLLLFSSFAVSKQISFNFSSEHSHFLFGHEIKEIAQYTDTKDDIRLTITPKSTTSPHLQQCHVLSKPHDIYVHQSFSGLGVKYRKQQFWALPFLDSGYLDSYGGYTDRLSFDFTNAATGKALDVKVKNIKFKRFEPILFQDNAYIQDIGSGQVINVSKDDINQNLFLELFPTTFLDEHTIGDWRFDTSFETSGFYITPGKLDAFKIYGLTIDVQEQGDMGPEITSEPILNAYEASEYNYLVQTLSNSADYEYRLNTFPQGMHINEATGQIQWTPSYEQSGDHAIDIAVTDAQGREASQQFVLTVVNTNRPPVISSTAIINAQEDSAYTYQVLATDPDGDALEYQLDQAPSGMSIGNTGLITWLPSYEQSGQYEVLVRISDSSLNVAHAYSITVENTNRIPVIESESVGQAVENQIFSHQVLASDADSQNLEFTLQNAPYGMTIDELGVINWTPTFQQSGNYIFIINVSDGEVNLEQEFTLIVENINQHPQITSAPITTANEGKSYQYTVVASDPDGDSLAYLLTSSPAGMTISSEGVINWQPSFEQSGSYPIEVKVDDQSDNIIQAFTLTVGNINRAPVISSEPVTASNENQDYKYTLVVNDPDGDSLQYELLDGPVGMSINQAGLIEWKPTFEQSGDYLVILKVSDQSLSVQQTFTLTVNNINRVPVISSEPVTVSNENQDYKYTLVASDPDGDSLQYELLEGPVGMSINQAGLIEWKPTFEQSGDYLVTLKVSDQNLSVQQTFTLTVNNINRAPEVSSIDNQLINENESFTYQIAASDPDGDQLSYQISPQLEGLVLDEAGLISWQPTFDQSGQYDLAIVVADDSDAVSAKLTLIVANSNRAPKITSTPIITAEENAAYFYQLTADDLDGDALTFELIAAPQNMEIDINGVLSWTPDFNDSGQKAVTVGVTDGNLNDTQSFVIDIINKNRIPMFTSTPITQTPEKQFYNYLAKAVDEDGDEIIYQILMGPDGMTMDSLTGELSWATTASDIGSHYVVIQAIDTSYAQTEQSFTLYVDNVNDAPIITSLPVLAVKENQPYSYQVSAVDEDGDSLNYELIAGPVGLTLSSMGVVNWLPGFDQASSASVSIRVFDFNGGEAIQSFDLDVENTNRSPSVAVVPQIEILALNLVQGTLIANDPDGDSLMFSVISGPSDFILDSNTGQFSWQTTRDDVGEVIIVVGVSDAIDFVETQVVVKVLPANEAPKINNDPYLSAVVGIEYNFQLLVGDVEGDELTYSISGADFLSITSDGQIHGTPLEHHTGSHDIVISVSDGVNNIDYGYQLNVVNLVAESPKNWGKQFWYGDILNGTNRRSNRDLKIFITSIKGASGTIETPANPAFLPVEFEVPENGVIEINYPIAQDVLEHDSITPKGIYISSDNDVGIYSLVFDENNTDALTLIPANKLAKEYVLSGYNDFYWSPSEYAVIATEDNTLLTLEPNGVFERANRNKIYPGEKLEVILQKGEMYYFNSVFQETLGLTGSPIYADKPIAAIVRHTCSMVPIRSHFCDRLVEQLPAVQEWGSKHALIPYASRKKDLVRIVSNEDNTLISIDGYATRYINKGEFWEYHLTEPQYIESSSPVLVSHFSASDYFDRAEREVDPYYGTSVMYFNDYGINRSPIYYESVDFKESYDVSIDPSTSDFNYVVLYVEEGKQDSVLVNNVPVAPTRFRKLFCIKCSGQTDYKHYMIAQVALPVGSHKIESTTPFGLYSDIDGLEFMADPFLAFEVPLDLALDHYIFTVSNDYYSRHFITAVIENDFKGTMTLDGNAIDGRYFKPLPGSDYVYAKLAINPGKHDIKADGDFSLMVYGYDHHDSYGFSGGVGHATPLETALIQLQETEVEKAIGEEACISGQLLALDYTPLEDKAIDVIVSGANSVTKRLFSQRDGVFEFCLVGSQQGNDNIEINVDNVSAFSSFLWTASLDLNLAPMITSSPDVYITTGDLYSYQVAAVDPEGEPLQYAIANAPAGMTISEAGLVEWNAVGGLHKFSILVTDPSNNTAEQKVALRANLPPVITGYPDEIVTTYTRYYLGEIGYSDDSDGTVRCDMISAPEHFEMHHSCIIRFDKQALNYQTGLFDISYQLVDIDGGVTQASYTLEIIEKHIPQVLNNNQIFEVGMNEPLSFKVDTFDQYDDELNLRFFLVKLNGIQVPWSQLSIDQTSKTIYFSPQVDQFGVLEIDFRLEHEHEFDGVGKVTFNINNGGFEITSLPTTTARSGVLYQYQITENDTDNINMDYILVSGPSGMSMNEDGLVAWTPTDKQVGNQAVTVEVRDGKNIHGQTFEITVQASDTKLSNELIISKRVVDPDEAFDVSGGYQNPLGDATESLMVDGAEVSLTEDGKASVSLIDPGAHSLIYTVSDSIESVSVEKLVYVKDPNDVSTPVVTLDSPISGEDLSAPQTIYGSVTDDQLIYWQVQLQKGNEPTATVLAEGESNIDAVSELATLDTTLMENGLYRLTLYAIDLGGNEAYAQSLFNVVGDLKVGNVQFSIEDVNIPLSGLPISVVRSYNSLRRSNELDLGYGWSVGYQDVTIDESMEPTKGWYQYVTQALFKVDADSFVTKATCIAPIGQKEVSVTLPDGEVESFTVKAKGVDGGAESASHPGCYSVRGRYFTIEFAAKEGTDSTLALNNFKGHNFYLTNVDDGHLTSDIIEPSYTPISSYSLTTKQGYIYNLNQAFGIESIIDPNGHVLTYTENGIEHSSGKGIELVRDEQGRIKNIVDPAGSTVMAYEYDTQGNLQFAKDVAAIEQGSNGVEYTYTSDHNLIDIIDPLGRPVVKNIYDDNGRLTGQEDANGNIKSFDHNIDARTSIITDLDGRSTIFNYDDEGNVTQDIKVISDASYDSDIVTTFGYDSNGNQLSKSIGDVDHTWLSTFEGDDQTTATDPEGNTVQYQNYNDKGQEGLIIDELGRQTVMEYDAVGNLTSIQMPDLSDADTGQVLNLSANNVINNKGQITQTTDLRGLVTTYTYYSLAYDAAGQKHTESNPVSGLITYTYDANNNVKTESRERTVDGSILTETVSYDYDARNRLTKTTYPDTTYTETVYDLAGNVDKERDRFGTWTDFEYDGYGRLTRTDYADNAFEAREYTAEGLLKSASDVSGNTTRYEYDDAGRLYKTINHDASFTQTRYTPQGWVKSEIDTRGALTEYQYDLAGKRKAILRHIEGEVLTHSFEYYDNGELKSETDANGHTTSYSINAFDQRTQTSYQNTTVVGQRYDAMGARLKQIDQNQRATQYGYDDLGRLLSVQAQVQINNEDVPATSYTYDQVGNKLTQTDAEGRTTTWTYDYFGRVLSRTLPEGMSETYQYDDANRQVIHTDFKGQITTTVNDVMGRVSSISYDDGKAEVFTYWPGGQIKTATVSETGKDDQITSYTYDNRDRLKTESQVNGTVLSYDYDANGNRTQVKTTRTTESGETQTNTVDYTYDALNRLETVTDSSGTTTYTYDAVGNQKTVTYPNGLMTEYIYNDVNQLENLITTNANGDVLSSYSYELDDTGRRESITEIRAEQAGRYTDYSYDNLYRLTDEVIKASIDATAVSYAANYQYDWVGNRTYETVDGVSTAYGYDLNDRLTSQGGTTYSYDNNGNTKTETLDGNVTSYTYNSKNKLTSIEKAGVVTGFTYDSNGIRNSKTENGLTTTYVVDSNRDYAQVLEEVVGGVTSVAYAYGHDLVSQNREGDFRFYQYDGLGSTRGLSNSAGIVTDTYDYEAFGEVINESGTTENNYKFTGEQFDASLDQYYLRARYYDQSVGRFTQQDTYMGNNFDPVSLHKYLYANADPLMYTDPTGNWSLGSAMASVNMMGSLSGSSAIILNRGLISVGGTSVRGGGILGSIYAMEFGFQLRNGAVSILSNGGGAGMWSEANHQYKLAGEIIRSFGSFSLNVHNGLEQSKGLLSQMSRVSDSLDKIVMLANNFDGRVKARFKILKNYREWVSRDMEEWLRAIRDQDAGGLIDIKRDTFYSTLSEFYDAANDIVSN